MARNSLKNVCRLIQAAQEQIPVEEAFLGDLKRSIELTDAKNQRQPSRSYKPSSMHCIRNMYYQVTGEIPDIGESSYTLIGICNAGTDIHQRIQKSVLDMADNSMDCEYVNVADYVRQRNLDYLTIVNEPDFAAGNYETKLYHKDLNISFLCDGIIKYKNRYYILELKTEGSNKFMLRRGVDPKHYNQGTTYSLAFGIDSVIFVYINRDIFDMKAYRFVPTDDMKNEIVGQIVTCDDYVNKQIAPPKPKDIQKVICEYCNYKTACRRDGE